MNSIPGLATQWATIVGVLLPLVIAIINREAWPSWAKALGALAVTLAAATGDTYFEGTFTGHDWAARVVYIFFLTVTTYAGLWRPTGLADKIGKATG